jgi:hypothetical protein
MKKTPEFTKIVVAKRQVIVGSFYIRNGFSKILWEYGTYTKEQYLEKRNMENEIRKAE